MEYRVLLVDDEKYVRVWLKNCIDWGAQGFRIIGEAINGEEALEAIERERPHLVISDMEMPRLNGNSLMQAARERFPDTCFVVVSGYSEFEYMRGAIKNAAIDYLLKPIKAEELIAVLGHTKARLQQREMEQSHSAGIVRENEELQTEGIALRLMTGLASDEECNRVKEQSGGWRALALDCREQDITAMREALRLLAEAAGLPCIQTDFAGEQICFVGTAHAGLDEAAVAAFANRLPPECRLCGISGEKPPEQLMQACWEARCALDDAELTGIGRCRIYQERARLVDAPVTVTQEQRLLAALFRGDAEAVHELVSQVFSQVPHTPGRWDSAQAAYYRLVSILLRFGYEAGVQIGRLQTVETELFSRIHRAREPEVLCGTIEALAQRIIDLSRKKDSKNAAALAREYVTKHYARDISLEDIAQYAGLSANYLCTLFKNELQCSVFDFVTQIRIDHAKELLLREHVKIYEIAEAVGYSEPKYFCKVFKKTTGLSPNEYRQRYIAREI